MRMEKKYNLLDMILQKHEEHSSDWEKDHPVGSRNMKIQQSDYDTYGRSDLLKEARELEEQKLIKVKWMGRAGAGHGVCPVSAGADAADL